jgi:hypothetical protein
MPEFLIRIFWLAVLFSAVAYVFFLLFGSLFVSEQKVPIVIQDSLSRGKHTFTGMVMVPSRCTELSAQATKVSPTVYSLELQTWEDPSVDCERVDTPRSFRTIAFAPAFGVQFLVFLDGQTAPFHIIPIIQKTSP